MTKVDRAASTRGRGLAAEVDSVGAVGRGAPLVCPARGHPMCWLATKPPKHGLEGNRQHSAPGAKWYETGLRTAPLSGHETPNRAILRHTPRRGLMREGVSLGRRRIFSSAVLRDRRTHSSIALASSVGWSRKPMCPPGTVARLMPVWEAIHSAASTKKGAVCSALSTANGTLIPDMESGSGSGCHLNEIHARLHGRRLPNHGPGRRCPSRRGS
ncbi:UNVERIFIED_ORG: hypothetical protein ABIB19_000162 [Arthrobacter sp. UYEF10]